MEENYVNRRNNKIIEEKKIHTVEVIHADTLGMLGGKMVPIKSFLKNYNSGFGVCRASLGWDIQGNLFEGVEISDFKTGCPDVIVKTILSTFREIPWRSGSAFVFGEIHENNGEVFKLARREILKELVSKYGGEFVNLFLSIGRNEVNLYEKAVTDWEFNRYFEYS
ncbi:hypothetical protein LL038_07310 [Clostridium estertheticum]|uniref:Uncharacterized protein n=2 Tax=Clostridium estertheticum TaxID=238834 RepID=A0AA47ENV5_9CLOT|nr:hypothetical protein [Clostridium estertheticum]MBU3154523.1 hypothetical protein [Clostridium estertheticum]WAG62043.1 hypothetical protein LL038_07310 [Clostridium estertheticum]